MPARTRVIEVWLGMYLSTGTATFSDLKLTATDAAGNEMQPVAAPTAATDTTRKRGTSIRARNSVANCPLVMDFVPLHAPAGKFGFVYKKATAQLSRRTGAGTSGIGYIKDWQPPKEYAAPNSCRATARAGIDLVPLR